jgi:ABC-type proline/glycine betaine transport system permease subunit
VSYSDLGTYVLSGLASQDNVEAFSGSILVALLAGLVAVVLGRVQRALTPAPLRAGGGAGTSARVRAAV